MPDPITWYTLSRTVTDIQSVMEAIDAKVLTHNLDPSAHGQSGEGIFTHRVASLLDHVNYSIYNIKAAPTTRAFKAFVGPAATGDFETLQAAIDYVNLHGGGRIYVRQGTYVQIADLVLYSNIHLHGEAKGLAIIDFANAAYVIKAVGDTSPYTTGTISVVHDDATVTGAGTSWAATLSAGDFILIDTVLYEIGSVTDNTHLELTTAYRGNDASGLSYFAGTFLKNVRLENLLIKRSNKGAPYYAGVHFGMVKDSQIVNCVFDSNIYNGIYLDKCGDLVIENNNFVGNTSNGVLLNDAPDCIVAGNTVQNLDSSGIVLQGTLTKGCVVKDNDILSVNESGITTSSGIGQNFIINNNIRLCKGRGILIYGGSHHVISGNVIYDCEDSGIELTSADRCIIFGNQVLNNDDYGIHITDALSDRNVVVANVVYGNTTGQIQDGGTDTELGHNVVA